MTCILKSISQLSQETKNNIYSYIDVDTRICQLLPLLWSVLDNMNKIQPQVYRGSLGSLGGFDENDVNIVKKHKHKHMSILSGIIQEMLDLAIETFPTYTFIHDLNWTNMKGAIVNPIITKFSMGYNGGCSFYTTGGIPYVYLYENGEFIESGENQGELFQTSSIRMNRWMRTGIGWEKCYREVERWFWEISHITTDKPDFDYKIKKMFIYDILKLREYSKSIPTEDFKILDIAISRSKESIAARNAERKKNNERNKLQRIANKDSIQKEQLERARQKALLAERRAFKKARDVITRLEKEESKMQKRERLLMENEEKAYIEAKKKAYIEAKKSAAIAEKEKIRLAKLAAKEASIRSRIEKKEKNRLAKLEKQEKAWVKKQQSNEAKSKI